MSEARSAAPIHGLAEPLVLLQESRRPPALFSGGTSRPRVLRRLALLALPLFAAVLVLQFSAALRGGSAGPAEQQRGSELLGIGTTALDQPQLAAPYQRATTRSLRRIPAASAAASNKGYSRGAEAKVVRGPPELPVVQNALDFVRYGGKMSEMSMALGKEFGGIAKARNSDRFFYFLNDPALVKEVTVTQSQAFYNRMGAVQNTINNATGIVSARQADHMRYRAMANPFFYNKRLLERYTSIVESETLAATAPWIANHVVDIQPVFKRLTLNVISKIAFTELETEGDSTVTLIRDLLDASGDVQRERTVSTLLSRLGEPVDNFTATLPFGIPKIKEVVEPPSAQRLVDLNQRLRQTEQRIIDVRRKQYENLRLNEDDKAQSSELPNDLLSVLISSQEDETRPLTDGEIQQIVREIIIAGSDTTASSIAATLFLLAREPRCQQRVRRELDAVIGTDPSKPISYADVDNLPYLRTCIKEAMRLYPAADVVFRTAGETATVGGYTIPEGSGVVISPVALGRNEEQWGTDAHRFRPERFEETGADGQPAFPKHPFAWLPFGAGPRGCLGGKLALMEATVACATVLRRWWLFLPAGAGQLTPRYSVTVEFEGGVSVGLLPRSGGERSDHHHSHEEPVATVGVAVPEAVSRNLTAVSL